MLYHQVLNVNIYTLVCWIHHTSYSIQLLLFNMKVYVSFFNCTSYKHRTESLGTKIQKEEYER